MTRKYIPALSLVSGVLPPVERAYALLQRASDAGFKWPDVAPVLKKVQEELRETETAFASDDPVKKKEELGDLLSACVNLARFVGVPVSELSLEPMRVTMEDIHNTISDSLAELERHPSSDDPQTLCRVKSLISGVASWAVLNGLDPQECLNAANQKFVERFNHVERTLHAEGRTMADASLREMVNIWNQMKPAESKSR